VSQQYLPGEEPLRTTRQHWAVFIPTTLTALGVLLVGGVILYVFPGDIGGHSLRQIKIFLGLAMALFVAVAVTLRYLRWRFTVFQITNRRVVVSRGVLSRYMESITLDRVQDTSVSQSLIGRIFKAGNVEIESAGRAEGSAVLKLIADPVGFSNTLQHAVEAHRTGQPFPSGQGGGQGGVPGTPAMPPGGGYVPPGAQTPGGYAPPPGYGPPPRRDV